MDISTQIQELSFEETQEVSGGFAPLLGKLLEHLIFHQMVNVYGDLSNIDWGEADYEDMMLAP